ncbi:putative zinc finger/helix-turn-helix protein, YgiT family [Candidatus Rubidus massiliensis]|nr:putative zinc finger/helix-turn-helix protein, YgiT family [Candidatus Rubidus massiliensis]
MNKKNNRLTEAILETAEDMYNCDILTENSYKKITMRHLKKEKLPKTPPISSEEIKAIRKEAHLSQAAFATYLNLTVSYISQIERGLKKPSGAALALLNVIKKNGFDVILR